MEKFTITIERTQQSTFDLDAIDRDDLDEQLYHLYQQLETLVTEWETVETKVVYSTRQ